MRHAVLQEEPRPEPSNENLIINELIREYMIFNGYRDTLSVFIPGVAGSVPACTQHMFAMFSSLFSSDHSRALCKDSMLPGTGSGLAIQYHGAALLLRLCCRCSCTCVQRVVSPKLGRLTGSFW